MPVCDNTSGNALNDNLHVHVQKDNDNMLYIDNICVHDYAEVQYLVNQGSYPADGVSTVKGELLCTHVTTDHSKGGGMYIMKTVKFYNSNVSSSRSKYLVIVTVSP